MPVHLVDLVLGESWRTDPRWESLARAGVRVAGATEIDISVADEPTRRAVLSYLDRNRTLARDLKNEAAIGAWVITRRSLGVWNQQAGGRSKGRGDLSAQFEALRMISETAEVAEAILGSEIDEDVLVGDNIEVVEREELKTVVRLRVEGTREWPGALGGASSANEIERVITLVANHASWRDRQVRRLARVEVDAIEILADPRELILELERIG